MVNPPVINASPLIYLSRANYLSLLQLLGSEILVPQAVAQEIQNRDAQDPTVFALRKTPWLRVVTPAEPAALIQAWDLGQGESAVLSWAYTHPGTEAILDDRAARRCAAALNLPVRGTLGLVLIAKQRGEVPSARVILEDLRRSGMYLSDLVLNQALAKVNE
ncbi:MAG: DUF3368 domain-containing protein [Prochlorothrix sp.]|nr:DUF3368 domain-containing protein [Prochlorothrix sp.]